MLSDQYSRSKLTRVLEVSRSSCYRSVGQGPRAKSDADLLVHIERIYKEHDQRYGSPRVSIQLHREGFVCSENRVARLMRKNGIKGLCANPKKPQTTDSNHDGPIAPNILKTLSVNAPNQAWAMDITYVRCGCSWVYLAAVLDLFLHKIVGWEISDRINSELTANALRRAVQRQGYPKDVLVHSDRGSQYASSEFISLVESFGYKRSMSAKGNCYDNATMESFFGVLKREELNRWKMPTIDAVRYRVFDYIETYYNAKRIHTTLGMSPVEFEKGLLIKAPSAEFLLALVAPSVGKKKAGVRSLRPRPMVATPEYPSASCSPAELASVSSGKQDIVEQSVESKNQKGYPLNH